MLLLILDMILDMNTSFPVSAGVGTFFGNLTPLGWTVFVAVLLWVVVMMVLKAYTLWLSARRGEWKWFVILFVVNTLGILELFYLWLRRHKDEGGLSSPEQMR